MAEIEVLPQKIVDKRTVILKSKLDFNMVRLLGEKIKIYFFTRFGFLKPKPREIVLVAFNKHYEPYIVIGGKYSIDYCKREKYTIKVEDKTQAFYVDGKELKSEPMSLEDNAKVIKLVGEEHSHYENETYIILDRMLQEVSSNNLFFAPFENDYETETATDIDLRKPQISLEEEIAFLRCRVAKRPADVAEIIRENFEINERTIIYNPVYELTYKNMKNGKTVTALINGITGDVIICKFEAKTSKGLTNPSDSENLVIQKQLFQTLIEPSHTRDDLSVSASPVKTPAKNLIVEEKVNSIRCNSLQMRGSSRVNGKNATKLATDIMLRLGYEESRFPTKVFIDNETDDVELQLQEENVCMQISSKTREVDVRNSRKASGRLLKDKT